MDKTRQDNDQNPIFIASNTPWHLTQGTKIVLLRPESKENTVSPKGKETTVLENTKCKAEGRYKKSDDGKTVRITCIHFEDISTWKFIPHNH